MLEQSHPRLYQWVKPRSLGLHLLFVLIATGCLIAGWWQVNRAMQGNTLSYLYSIEWPAFAVVAGIGWWQMFHDTPEDIARRREYHEKMRAASAEVVARTLPRSARALTVDSAEVDGRALGAGSARVLTAGGPAAAAGPRIDAVTGEPIPASAALVRTGGEVVPGTGTEAALLADDDGLLADDDAGVAGDELTEYNRYLALLAVRGRSKTWRNPHGV